MDNKDRISKILPVNIEDEMKKSYIEYAMSVIVSRALPDVRDGLKPVHRRILYSMNELHLDPSKGYKKSARIVGDTMGKYHPHGDSSIYDAMVRMAQPFAMRYMLVDGHGNFGSIDGDGAAAQRYTEAKLSRISTVLLSDIDKNTVDFMPNYDEEFLEPTVLPARYPNLLVNGSSGIAVGMATNILPHNLNEVISAVVKIIDNFVEENRETELEELLNIVKGPDFPTGATIFGVQGILDSYKTGRGRIVARAKCDIEPMKNGKNMIVATEIPYQVNKAKLIEKIADLVKNKKIDGITDLRDESDRNGIRIVIELRKDVNPNIVLNQLYKYSQLQESYGVNMLALVNNEPRVLNLKQILVHYLNHQKEVVTRRTKFELDKAEKRAHILEGLLIALDNIDEVIRIIRSSQDVNIAKAALISSFDLSEIQATAIVDMRLRALTGLERGKIEKEYNGLMELISYLKSILGDEKLLYGVIRDEITEVQNKYKDDRRTEILPNAEEINIEDLIEDEPSVITMTHMDYIKRIPLSTYKSQNRGGRGILGMKTRDEDDVRDLFTCTTHNTLLFFTNKGKVYKIKAYQVAEAGRNSRGTPIINLLNLDGEEKIKAVIPMSQFDHEHNFVMLTKKGVIKKTSVADFKNIRQNGLIALNIREDDELISVKCTEIDDKLFIATKNGNGIKFEEQQVRCMGRTATGVRAIRLKNDDEVIDFVIAKDNEKILLVSENGYGKCTTADSFKIQNRGGSGVKNYKVTEKTGSVVGISKVNDNEEVMLLNSNGVIIRIRVADIATTGRVTQGVKLINLNENESVISLSKISEQQINDENIDYQEELNNNNNNVEDDNTNSEPSTETHDNDLQQ